MGRERVKRAVMLGALLGIYVINTSPAPYEVLLCWSPVILSFKYKFLTYHCYLIVNNESSLPVITFEGLQQISVGQACDAKLCLLRGSFHKPVSDFLIFSNSSLTPQNESSRNIVNGLFAGKL